MKYVFLLFLSLIVLSCSQKFVNDLNEIKNTNRLNGVNNLRPIINTGSFEFYSKVLKENREVYVSLPPNYERNVHRYPVVFVLDGEFLFDIANSIASFRAKRNYMPESIIIGIPNNNDRLGMALVQKRAKDGNIFGFGGKTNEYIQFFKGELIPYLEKVYRINKHRTIIGMSPTNGPVFQDFWSKSSLFTAYIALAADLRFYLESDEMVTDKLLSAANNKKQSGVSLYIARAGDDVSNTPAIGETYLETKLKFEKLMNKNINYQIEILQDENHYGLALTGIKRGFDLIYHKQDWDVEYTRFVQADEPSKAIKDYFDGLSRKYGLTAVPFENRFWDNNNFDSVIDSIIDIDKKLKAIQLALTYYPSSPLIHRKLSDTYILESQYDKALEIGKKLVQLAKTYEIESLASNLYYLADIYELDGQYKQALLAHKGAINYSEKHDRANFLSYQQQLARRQSRIENPDKQSLAKYIGVYQLEDKTTIKLFLKLGKLYARSTHATIKERHETNLYLVIPELIKAADDRLNVKGWTADEHFLFTFDADGEVLSITMVMEDDSYNALKIPSEERN